jgi:hypothetical protein
MKKARRKREKGRMDKKKSRRRERNPVDVWRCT